jgi:hypothetical protein
MFYWYLPAIIVDFLGQSSQRGGKAVGSNVRLLDEEAILAQT